LPKALTVIIKIKEIEQHVLINKNGIWIAEMVTITHIHDSRVTHLLMQIFKKLYSSIEVIIDDEKHRGEISRQTQDIFEYALKVVISNYDKIIQLHTKASNSRKNIYITG